jgi:23S rRNA (uracil747-C5)-methyltransferase
MYCAYFERGICRSCHWLADPYLSQLQRKLDYCQSILPGIGDVWLPAVPSDETGFRNKAKMVVSGHPSSPYLGILDAAGDGIDLSNCPLYPAAITNAFEPLKRMISRLGIPVYDVGKRSGELKYLLITVAEQDDSLMVRFVLRSDAWLGRLRSDLPVLMTELPNLAVLSVNIQPVHQAILEGDQEAILTERKTLTMHLNGRPFYLRPKSFFQTNTRVAEQLYATVRHWVAELAPSNMWDLFCGVGGFALHCADVVPGLVTGIEISADAIASAQQSALELGFGNVSFHALGADEFIHNAVLPSVPDLVVVNPPRRGLGAELCAFLNDSDVATLIYSSCNPDSLARDMSLLPGFELVCGQVFDMFPHTSHCEVLVLLRRASRGSDTPS